MPVLRVDELIVDPTIQIRRGNHEHTIRRYEEAFDNLPPVDVFKTPDGLLLADGFHRVAAAQRLGKREINGTIHRGTRTDALEFAVIGNTKNADPLTEDERDDGIRRLRELHPDWPARHIAEAMSVSSAAVGRVFKAEKVARALPNFVSARTRTHVIEVASAPQEQWKPLLEAAEERKWTRDETRLAVQNLKSARVPQTVKRDILAGKADPVAVDEKGEFSIPVSTVGRKVQALKQSDALLALYRALEVAGRLRHLDMAKLADGVAEDGRLPRVTQEVEEQVEIWKELLAALRKVKSRKLEVV